MSVDQDKMQAVLKKSLVTIKKLEKELTQYKSKESEEISIVGFSCRFPGGITDLDKLYEVLSNKRSVISEIPKERFDIEAIYDNDILAEGKTNVKHGAFLEEDVSLFDAAFFGIPPREAKSIDPIHRMLLELSQEALEDAAIPPSSLKGGKVGVYAAIGNSDYMQARAHSGDLKKIDLYDTIGVAYASASGRASYLFDLQGPSYTIDATCSSALVAAHLACQDLKNGVTDLAIVSAGNLILGPEIFVGLSKLGSLSEEGICRAFDQNADGFVRGEGMGVMILKRKSEAKSDNNRIYANIKGSAIRHNGTSNGFTAPNPIAQQKAIAEALKMANVSPNQIDFVEIHGIGNTFTDALEANAVGKAYKEKEETLYLGTLKPNVGHLEAAIGMAMMAKILCSFKYKTIFPNINIEKLNEDIEWERNNIKVPQENIPWDKEGTMLAAINLSGFTGTNIHMILEHEEVISSAKTTQHEEVPALINISAKSEESLKATVKKYIENSAIWEKDLSDIAYTLNVGRDHYDEKLSIVSTNAEKVQAELKNFIEGNTSKVIKVPDNINRNREIAFLYTGQGAQYHKMCEDLYKSNSTFKETLDECNELLKGVLEIPLLDILYSDDIDKELVNQSQYTQPALFAVEYAMSKMWMSWGIEPAAVMGHSVGEFTAATIAGVFSLEDGLRLVAERGKLIQLLPLGVGGMAAVLSSKENIEEYLQKYEGKIDVAAINSPRSITVSGNIDAINEFVNELKQNKIKAVKLNVSHAFHSYLLDPILDRFRQIVSKVPINNPQIPLISNVTGKHISKEELTPDYFANHVRNAVLFADGISCLSNEYNIDLFLEVGPNPTLIGLAKQGIDKENVVWMSSSKKNKNSWQLITESLQQLYLNNVKINWNAVYNDKGCNVVKLPTYSWQKSKYWYNPVQSIKINTNKLKQETNTNANARSNTNVNEISRNNLMDLMQKEAVKVLGLRDGSKLDPIVGLREQGYDSMMAAQLLKIMERHLGVELDMSILLVYNSLQTLHDYFLNDILGDKEFVTISKTSSAIEKEEVVLKSNTNNWNDIKDSDGWLMRVFKRIDKAISIDEIE